MVKGRTSKAANKPAHKRKPVRPRGGRMFYNACELFAGVGGFRIALEDSGWKVQFSNQWEPGKKVQHASDCYVRHFGSAGHSNEDIAKVAQQLKSDPATIPDHDLLVGGFPCQDYSVATTKAKGIEGKKGVLWWEIHKILEKKRPRHILLENVDRLLTSPGQVQRGRDFAIILACLRDLGYAVEWRMINAAEFGFAQKRRRTFILASHIDTQLGKEMMGHFEPGRLLDKDGVFAKAFPVHPNMALPLGLPFNQSIQQISDTFSMRFENAGLMLPRGKGVLWTFKTLPNASRLSKATLKSVLVKGAPTEYYVDQSKLWKKEGNRKNWEYVKGAKREPRKTQKGFIYTYNEGAIPFPDNLDQPSRTVLTGDGNRNPNRISHIIQDPWTKKFRVLTPMEMERLNGFPDDWTEGMPTTKRYFCMGNALVIGVVEKIAKALKERIQSASTTRVQNTSSESEAAVA